MFVNTPKGNNLTVKPPTAHPDIASSTETQELKSVLKEKLITRMSTSGLARLRASHQHGEPLKESKDVLQMPLEPQVVKKPEHSPGIPMTKTATKFRNHKRVPSETQSPFKQEP